MLSFIECFDKYKGQIYDCDGTDKGTTHSYLELYQKILTPHKENYISIVEIGVKSGGSCSGFSDFFQNASVYGVDINFNNLIYGKENPKIKYIEADGTHDSILNKINLNQIDLVLDDGSHIPDHQIKTVEIFLPYISKNGMFICEDINQYSSEFIKSEFTNLAKKNEMILDWYDLRHIKNRFDDIVAVFHH
jgi:cephalosporin hydroxylase